MKGLYREPTPPGMHLVRAREMPQWLKYMLGVVVYLRLR